MLFTAERLEAELIKLSVEWTVLGGASLVRVFEFDNFSSGVGFIVKIGELADRVNHHPEIKLS